MSGREYVEMIHRCTPAYKKAFLTQIKQSSNLETKLTLKQLCRILRIKLHEWKVCMYPFAIGIAYALTIMTSPYHPGTPTSTIAILAMLTILAISARECLMLEEPSKRLNDKRRLKESVIPEFLEITQLSQDDLPAVREEISEYHNYLNEKKNRLMTSVNQLLIGGCAATAISLGPDALLAGDLQELLLAITIMLIAFTTFLTIWILSEFLIRPIEASFSKTRKALELLSPAIPLAQDNNQKPTNEPNSQKGTEEKQRCLKS